MAKLEKFKKDSDKPTIKQILFAAGVIVVLLGAFVLYRSFALYTTNESHDVIKAKIKDFKKDMYVYYDNTNTGINCTNNNANVKCAIDNIADMLEE